MNPNTFLKTFWRLELNPQVFVAMTFSADYQPRFDDVIAPAVRSVLLNNAPLQPYRVDVSQSGDSILTDISDGIAHSQLVLADVSTVGKDSVTGIAYRNANVMYEVGLALSCRQPSEVLLVRDDHDRFLFDVSTVPHVTIDFTDTGVARQRIAEELLKRLREQRFVNDARVQLAIASLSAEEVSLLKKMDYAPTAAWGRKVMGLSNWFSVATSRLLDKQLIRVVGEFGEDKAAFAFTPLGHIVQQLVKTGLRKFDADEKPDDSDEDEKDDEQGQEGDQDNQG